MGNSTPQSPPEDRWISTWAYMLNALSRGVSSVESEYQEVAQLFEQPGKRAKVGAAIDGASWANLYEWPMSVQFAWSCIRIIPLRDLVELFSPHNFKQRFAELHDGKMLGSDYDPSAREMPKILSHARALTAQLRALVYCGRSMSELIRGAREDDDDLFLAIRLDPAVITGRFASRRIQRALAVEEPGFITKLTSALRSPIKVESDLARLQRALWLMSVAKQLHRLTEKNAADLFIHRTHLYPHHGAKDAERSLWRYIQRWKKEHATNVR